MNRSHVDKLKTGLHVGFTLIEILIAIGLVALLTTMLVIAVAPGIESAKVNATKAIIAQVDQQLQRRLAAFNGISDKTWEDLSAKVLATWGTTPVPNERIAKVLVKKNRYQAAFPQRIQDLYGMDGISSLSVANPTAFQQDDRLLKQIRDQFPATPLPLVDELSTQVSSSEMIYFLLTQGQALGTESYSLDGIPARFITDSDGDGLMEIRDAWGNELVFYNAPTALLRPSGSADMNLSVGARIHFASLPGDDGTDNPARAEVRSDPFDRLGVAERFNASLNQFFDKNTYFAYLIVSAGPDGELGMNLPGAAGRARLAMPVSGSFDAMTDNITNRQ